MKKNAKYDDNSLQKSGADMHTDAQIDTDPFGSWTGVPDDEEETPVQDADDL